MRDRFEPMARRRHSVRRSLPLALCVVAALLAAACGTTAQQPAVAPIADAARPSAAAAQTCAADHPATWMGCLVAADPAFGTFPLSGISLPGSRNAGTWQVDPQGWDTHTGTACTDYLPRDLGDGVQFSQWSQTQDESITSQLDQGIRVLDLQVAYNGGGDPLEGWRVVQSEFSTRPLHDYLGEIATWAAAHPSEVVLVDISAVCYDGAGPAVADGLWSSFATTDDYSPGHETLADVAFDPAKAGRSVADTSIDQVVRQGGGGHNVIVVLPGHLQDSNLLASEYHVHAVTAVAATSQQASPTTVAVERADAHAVPLTASSFAAADSELAGYPTTTQPALGSLYGTGLYEDVLDYDFDTPARSSYGDTVELFSGFGGLVVPSTPGAAGKALPAWEAALWGQGAPRDGILHGWGHRLNIVLADGVEHGDYIGAVIDLNSK